MEKQSINVLDAMINGVNLSDITVGGLSEYSNLEAGDHIVTCTSAELVRPKNAAKDHSDDHEQIRLRYENEEGASHLDHLNTVRFEKYDQATLERLIKEVLDPASGKTARLLLVKTKFLAKETDWKGMSMSEKIACAFSSSVADKEDPDAGKHVVFNGTNRRIPNAQLTAKNHAIIGLIAFNAGLIETKQDTISLPDFVEGMKGARLGITLEMKKGKLRVSDSRPLSEA